MIKRFFNGKGGSAKEQAEKHVESLDGFKRVNSKSNSKVVTYEHPDGRSIEAVHHGWGMSSVMHYDKNNNALKVEMKEYIKHKISSLMETVGQEEPDERALINSYWERFKNVPATMRHSSGNKPEVTGFTHNGHALKMVNGPMGTHLFHRDGKYYGEARFNPKEKKFMVSQQGQ